MSIKTLHIHLKVVYPLYFSKNLWVDNKAFLDYCQKLKKRLVIIHDNNHYVGQIAQQIEKILQPILPIEKLCFLEGEMHKTREMKQVLEDQLLEKKYGRDTCLIAVGGGVASDLIGFLASTYCRGIPCIYMPTTLLAMVDASIGGKTGVNTSYGKNLIGSFHQPEAVFVDISTLKTLPKREWRNGIVEIIKHALIVDAELFKLLEKTGNAFVHDTDALIEIIYRSCCIKKQIVEKDEKELGLRELLNYGHTIGHAIEHIEQYAISHGEAVAIGMLVEAYLSVQCGFLSEDVLRRIENLLKVYQLPLKTKAFEDKARFLEALTMDKKSKAGDVYFVLLEDIGKARIINTSYSFCVDAELLNKTLDWAHTMF